jgi:YVTN family beta-propeller protein
VSARSLSTLNAWIATAVAAGVATDACSSHAGVADVSEHSSSIAVSFDAKTVYVVNADADSVSFLDAHTRTLTREVLLASVAPAVDATGRFDPAVGPRALALGPNGATLYVTGERSGHVYAIDTATGAVLHDAAVCSEPVGVLASPDGSSVYVACSQDDMVVALDASSLAKRATTSTDRKPWGLGWSADHSQIYVTHLLGPGVTVLEASSLAVSTTWALLDGPPRNDPDTTGPEDPLLPHGPVRGIYDALARPGSNEVWVAHMMLGIDTPEPTLVFNMTAFPSLSLFDPQGEPLTRLSVSAVAGDGGAFGDVTSGPRAMAFSPDGRFAFVVDTASEDVLVVDARTRFESSLVRPLPGHQPEGIAVSSDGHVYVDERNTSDVAVLDFVEGDTGASVTVDGATIPRLAHGDPMTALPVLNQPNELRTGQHMFNSANSDELPTTQNHWVACTTCHIEARSDAVTWRFNEGPRDTPSNAGGVLQTGFLLRNAARNKVQDYWQTIDAEQGGSFPDPTGPDAVPALGAELDALAQYVNYAIPYPVPPSTLDPSQVAAGAQLFQGLGCPSCHAGTAFTDSGHGNPTLDLTILPLLHDVGTCVTTGPYPDVATPDELGDPRPQCSFDTPTLRGVSDSAPYLHDGSAATLFDVFARAPGMGASTLSQADQTALVAYLRSL